MTSEEMFDKIEETIRAIKSSYRDKYSENDYSEFRTEAQTKAKNLKHLVILTEYMFDLDHADAYDMVN